MLKTVKEMKNKKTNTETTSVNAFWKHATPLLPARLTAWLNDRPILRSPLRSPRQQSQPQQHRPRSTAMLSTLRSTATFGFPHFPVRVARQPVGVEMKYVDESLINLRHDKTSGVSLAVSLSPSLSLSLSASATATASASAFVASACWQAF